MPGTRDACRGGYSSDRITNPARREIRFVRKTRLGEKVAPDNHILTTASSSVSDGRQSYSNKKQGVAINT